MLSRYCIDVLSFNEKLPVFLACFIARLRVCFFKIFFFVFWIVLVRDTFVNDVLQE